MSSFIKKIVHVILLPLFAVAIFSPWGYSAIAAPEISSVSYVHKTIKSMKNLDVPIPSTAELKQINSVAYLMKQIDDANEILNNSRTTDYASSGLALRTVMVTTAADEYIDELIKKLDVFELTVAGVNSFDFQISASGHFVIDWGDGNVDRITKNNINNTTYSHIYSATGNYKIRIMGKATGYNTTPVQVEDLLSLDIIPTISFSNSTNREKITGISGGLGRVFSTLPDGTNPRFVRTFAFCDGLTGEIPADLFDGITGAPADGMFIYTFYGCNGLTGGIPAGLFAGISGPPTIGIFLGTFLDCSRLTGKIPSNLFAGISGAPAIAMFSNVFDNCRGLTGEIPANLFAGISGAPAIAMFSNVFDNCRGLTGKIPSNLFAGISGAPADAMFNGTFNGCGGLTGSIPPGLFGKLEGAPADFMFRDTFNGCSGLTGSIPANLFAGISGVPADAMFNGTFNSCRGLTGSIPPGLFGKLEGAPADDMFSGTFNNCRGLTGSIPAGLFGKLEGAPAGWMFRDTFNGCSGLTGSIPAGLFGKLEGNPKDFMFFHTFDDCSGLTGIDDGIWDLSGVTDTKTYQALDFSHMFTNCSNITSPSPTIAAGSDVKLWEHFTEIGNQAAFFRATQLADYDDIPDGWK